MMRGKWKKLWPRGSGLISSGERMNIMRVQSVFTPVYGAIEQSSNRGAPQIAMSTLGSFSRYEKVRVDGFSILWRFCG